MEIHMFELGTYCKMVQAVPGLRGFAIGAVVRVVAYPDPPENIQKADVIVPDAFRGLITDFDSFKTLASQDHVWVCDDQCEAYVYCPLDYLKPVNTN
jgi:hypothetical protein